MTYAIDLLLVGWLAWLTWRVCRAVPAVSVPEPDPTPQPVARALVGKTTPGRELLRARLAARAARRRLR